MDSGIFKKDKLYAELKQEIISGKYAPGARLPKELEFSRMLGVAKVTLRSALERLEAEKLIVRLPRKGTFIREDQKPNLILIGINRRNAVEMPHNYIIPGISAEASEMGYRTEQCFVEYLRELKPEKALGVLRGKNLCGVLLVVSNLNGNEPELGILRQLNLPVIIVHGDEQDKIAGFPLLFSDIRKSWKAGLEYLAQKGYRNVKLLMKRDRNRGWTPEESRELFRELGLKDTGRLVYEADLSRDSVRGAMDEMLPECNTQTAIYCYSDFYAMEAMKYLQERKIRIPEELAVMGYCGYPGDALLDPPLSTVDLEYADIGRMAVRLLTSPSWPESPEHSLLATPYRVIERESTFCNQYHSNNI